MSNPQEWVYSEKVKEHFMHPRNVLDDESAFAADGKGVIGNIKCGDEMVVLIKVDKQRGLISDCKWRTFGCASAIASTSILSELAIGRTLEQAYKLGAKDIAAALGGLPEHKIHCSVLGDKALRAAIEDYYLRNGQGEKVSRQKEHIVCQCLGITDLEIENEVLEGVRDLLQLQERNKLGTVCGQCKEKAGALIAEYIKKHFSPQE